MDETGLETGLEKIQLTPLHHIQVPGPVPSPSPPSYSLDKTQRWVTWNTHNVLYLPLDYRRPKDFVVKDNILAIGHYSGGPTFLEFKSDFNP